MEWQYCPLTSLQFPIMGKLRIKSFAHTPGASGLSSIYNLCYVPSVFWLFFQSNFILFNHPHPPSSAKSEWWVCRKVVVKHSINQIKCIRLVPFMKTSLVLSELWGLLWVKRCKARLLFLSLDMSCRISCERMPVDQSCWFLWNKLVVGRLYEDSCAPWSCDD